MPAATIWRPPAPDKQTTEAMPQSIHLADYACLTVSGEDASSFLQGQLSNDVNATQASAGQLTSLNSAKGRVIAMIRLVRTDAAICLVLPAALADSVAAHLIRFVLRARARIAQTPNRIYGLVMEGAPAPAATDLAIIALPGNAALHLAIDLDPTRQTPRIADGSAISRQQWEQLEIEAGIPEISAATRERFVAQMINLDLLGGISFTKGCYVGQEIIARAHHLGRIKRRMALFRTTAEAAAGDPVWAGGRQVGSVVRSTVIAPGRSLLLATLPVGAVAPGLGQDGPALESVPLPYPVPAPTVTG